MSDSLIPDNWKDTYPLGMTSQNPLELMLVVNLFKTLSPRDNVLEIGSLIGETLRCWMDNMESGSHVLSVDILMPQQEWTFPIQKRGHESEWRKWAEERKLHFDLIESNSTLPETVAKARDIMPNVDFLFIDGAHDYETVLSDWTNYSPLVRTGGMVLFHDLGKRTPDVRKVWSKISPGYKTREILLSDEEYGFGILWK